jgi:hypothetical protein
LRRQGPSGIAPHLVPSSGDGDGRSIGAPYNVQHEHHAEFDPNTGEFTGLPPQWANMLASSGISKDEVRVFVVFLFFFPIATLFFLVVVVVLFCASRPPFLKKTPPYRYTQQSQV